MLGNGGADPYVTIKRSHGWVPCGGTATGQSMNPNYRNLALWAIIVPSDLPCSICSRRRSSVARRARSPIRNSCRILSGGRVKTVTIAGDRITGTYIDNASGFQTYSPGDPTLVQRLEEKGVTINARPRTTAPTRSSAT